MFILSWKMLTFYWEILTDCLRKGKAKVLPRTQPIVFFFFLHSFRYHNKAVSTIWSKRSKYHYDQTRQHFKKQRHYFVNKVPSSQSYGFSSSHVWMWELDYKESWGQKYWCFWTVVLEKTLESPLDCKEIQPVNLKWNQSWIFIGRTDAEAETPIFWPPDAKNWLIGKDPETGKDWRQEEKKTGKGQFSFQSRRKTEDETVGCHHWWVWASSGWWWTGKPGVLQSMGSQRVRHDWATE